MSEAAKKKWADAYMWFYRRLALKHSGKPLVMKTPANAARVKVLNRLFPDARWVFIAHNPLDVFPSTVKLWRALYSTQGLHNPPHLEDWLDDYVLDSPQATVRSRLHRGLAALKREIERLTHDVELRERALASLASTEPRDDGDAT